MKNTGVHDKESLQGVDALDVVHLYDMVFNWVGNKKISSLTTFKAEVIEDPIHTLMVTVKIYFNLYMLNDEQYKLVYITKRAKDHSCSNRAIEKWIS